MLVDEQFGSTVPQEAKAAGLKLAMPAERSGQNMFDFQYGDEFGEHILAFDPDFTKVLVRYNPDGDAAENAEQLGKLKILSDWLKQNGRKFLFELLVPAEPAQLDSVGGDTDRYDAELRPELMRRAIVEIQDAGIEVDIWKIEGVDERSDCEMLAEQTRAGGRDGVTCVVLGRGADDAKVDEWLHRRRPGRGLHRLRDRALDLVGPAQGLRRRQDRARRGRAPHRRELPALRLRLRAGDEGRGCVLGQRWSRCSRSRRRIVVSGKDAGSAVCWPKRGCERSECPRLRYTRSEDAARRERVVKMRQSLADWEQAFVREITLDRVRRDSLRRTAEQRTAKREVQKRQQRGKLRFLLLVATLILTAVVVTVVMFRTLYLLLG